MKTIDIGEYRKRLLAILIRDAFVREKITLSSGKESDFYIDARRVTLSPEGVYLCAGIILEMIKNDGVDAVGGPTLGADPLVGAIASLSHQVNRPINTFIVRQKPKPHGKQQQIEGPLLKKGSRVILIDDVATTGTSIIQAMDVLKPMEVSIVKAICIVDRREGAQEALANRQCALLPIFSILDFPK